MPGRIETYDSAKCKASIQILIEDITTNEIGERIAKPLPIITDVPVQTLGDGFGMRIELPLAKGDYVTVLFASRSVDRWLAHGGLVDPGDERDHDLSDAVAIPGLFDFAHVKKPVAKIKFTSNQVQIGGTDALALLSELNSLRSTFNTHVHPAPGGTTSATGTTVSSFTGTNVLKGG